MKCDYQTLRVWLGVMVIFCSMASGQSQFWDRTEPAPPLRLTWPALPDTALFSGPVIQGNLPQRDIHRFGRTGILPLGLDWHHKINRTWDLTLLLEYDWVGMTSVHHLQREWAEELGVIRSQGSKGRGLSAAIQFTENHRQQGLMIQPYYRLWDIQGFVKDNRHLSQALNPNDRGSGQKIQEYGVQLTWRF